MSALLTKIVGAVVGGFAKALLDYFERRRRDKELEEKGAADAALKGHKAASEARRRADAVRDRLRNDPEYRRRVREHFSPSSRKLLRPVSSGDRHDESSD